MRLFLSMLLMLWSCDAIAQTQAEKYEYEVHWGYSDVARVTLQRGCPRDGYRPAKLSAKSLGVIEQLHAFEIKLDSFVDLDGRTLEGRTFIEEEGVPRRYRSRFAATGVVKIAKHYKNKDSTLALELRPGTFDLLSWSFELRAAKLSRGNVYQYYVWDGWKLTRVSAVVGKLETVWTPQGMFEARRIDLTRVRLHHSGAKKYEPRANLENIGTMWLATDDVRTPVAMDFGAPVGLAKLRLLRAKTVICR